MGQPSIALSSSPLWTFPYYLYQSPHPLLLLLQTLLPAVCNGIMLCSDVLPTDLPDHSFPTPFVCSFSSLACACSLRHFLALLFSTFSSLENLQILSERSDNFSSAPCGLLPSLIFFLTSFKMFPCFLFCPTLRALIQVFNVPYLRIMQLSFN